MLFQGSAGSSAVPPGTATTALRTLQRRWRSKVPLAKPHIFQPLLARDAGAYQLVNRTRGLVLATRIEQAFDSHSRRTGLLGREGLPPDTVMAIAPSNAIHTFGMKFPIDVLFITRDGVVVKRLVAMKRGRLSAAWRGFAVLEFGAHHPGVAATHPGDLIAVQPLPGGAR